MSDQNKEDQLDFTSSTSFQHSVKKAKRKQTIKYSIIGLITSGIVVFGLYYLGAYVLQQKISEWDPIDDVRGANVTRAGSNYSYTFFSALETTTYHKEVGGRPIVWNIIEKQIPMIGSPSIRSSYGATGQMNDEEDRMIAYNEFNNERVTNFYGPDYDYNFLPQELNTAVNLDENKRIEVALSFDQAYSLDDIQEKLGAEQVEWLWVQTKEKDVPEVSAEDTGAAADHYLTYHGDSVYGFQVRQGDFMLSSEQFNRSIDQLQKDSLHASIATKLSNKMENGFIISGAVVSGSPEELERFQSLSFIRASTIGATVDQY